MTDTQVPRSDQRLRRKIAELSQRLAAAEAELVARRLAAGPARGTDDEAPDGANDGAALRASEERFRTIFEHVATGIAITDPLGRFVQCNAAYTAMLGYTEEELRSEVFADLVHPDDRAANLAENRRLAAGEVPFFEIENRYVRRDGEPVWVHKVVSRLNDDAGALVSLVALVTDITERRRAQEQLAFLADLSAAFGPVASAQDIARVAAEGITRHFGASRVSFSDVNVSGDEVTSFLIRCDAGLEEDRSTHRLADYLSPDLVAELAAGRSVAIHDVRQDGRTSLHAEAYTRRGVRSMVLTPYVADGRWQFLLVVHKSAPYDWRPDEIDLLHEIGARTYLRRERARGEEALRIAHDTFHHLVEHSPFGIYAVNADFRLVLVSAGAQKVFGNVRPLIGRDFANVLRTIWPEPFASEAIARFRHTLETGEPYHAPSTVEHRHDIDVVESYDWKTERVTLPDGRYGVVCHFYDLSERLASEAALRAADRQKDEFLAVLAHELRNPLAPIRTAVGILRARGGTDPLLGRCRDIIERQTAHMARLLDDLLDVSRLSCGRLVLKRAVVPLDDVLDAAVETSRPLIDHHGQQLTVSGRELGLSLDADATRLTQVFANLLNNAAKYGGTGGRIELSVSEDAGMAVVRVRDTGIGIAADMLDRVFDLFAQAPDSRSHAAGGLGIGLSLAKRLVTLHGGEIVAASDGPGRGSEFTVRLPLVRHQAQVPAGRSPGTGDAGLARRVLVVDDNVDAADTTGLLLASRGCEVRVAYDGAAALVGAAAFRPEVVFLDLGMRGLDGYGVCQAIRAADWGRGIVVVAVSGWGQDEDRNRSAAAGFDRHLVKPVDPDVLVQIVSDAPRRRASAG